MKFVSSPEVLERFVSVEREIVQIENELNVEEAKSNFSSKVSLNQVQSSSLNS